MTMKSALGGLAAVTLGLAVAAGGAVVSASPAQAAPSCASGYTCMWKNSNYSGGGGKISFQYYIPNLGLWAWPDGSGANDSVSSVWCSGNYEDAYLFENSGGTGKYHIQLRGRGTANLADNGFNDKTSSAYFSGYVS